MDSFKLGLLVILVLFAVCLPLLFWRWKPQFWRDLADLTKLTYKPDWLFLNPHVTGKYEGFQVVIDNFTDYTKSLREYVRITVFVNNPKIIGFSIADKDFPIAVLDRLYFSQAIALDDPELDARFHVRGQIDQFTKGLLTNQIVRTRLLKMSSLHIQLWDRQLQYKKSGLEADISLITSTLSLLIILARAIDFEGIQNSTQI